MSDYPTFIIGADVLLMENGTVTFGFGVKGSFVGKTNNMGNG